MADCNNGIISSVEVPVPTDDCACVGVASIVWNTNNTVTITLTNGSSITSPILLGPQGLNGADGLPGANGTNGVNGASVEMNYDIGTKTIQWRLVGSSTWINLYTFPTDETWKSITNSSTGTFADGSLIPSLIGSPFTTSGGLFVCRKLASGIVEIDFGQTALSCNFLSQVSTFDVLTMPASYRPSVSRSQIVYLKSNTGTSPYVDAYISSSTGILTLTRIAGESFYSATPLQNILTGRLTYSTT